MFGLLRRIVGIGESEAGAVASFVAAPESVQVEGAEPFRIVDHLDRQEGFPVVRWEDVRQWIETIPEEQRKAQAWGECERAWLLHMRDALGPQFRLHENEGSMVLSSLEPRLASQTLDFMAQTLRRIVKVLDGVAESHPWGKDLLLVFDDEESYYRYVSGHYPERGEFAFSSGMHLDRGCSHYVTTKSDLRTIEPVIAHEMTHGCVNHLPLPLWLNEGLAVNTEHRIVGPGYPLFTPQEMHAKHMKFWGEAEIQEFWSGKSFRRTDDGNLLSYDLGRVLIDHVSADWRRFRSFATAATWEDGGAAAAREHLGVQLGAMASALFEKEASEAWEPDPSRWEESITKPEPRAESQ